MTLFLIINTPFGPEYFCHTVKKNNADYQFFYVTKVAGS